MESFEWVDAYKLELAKSLAGYVEPDGHPVLHNPQMISCFKIVPTYTHTPLHYQCAFFSFPACVPLFSLYTSVPRCDKWLELSGTRGGGLGSFCFFHLRKSCNQDPGGRIDWVAAAFKREKGGRKIELLDRRLLRATVLIYFLIFSQ